MIFQDSDHRVYTLRKVWVTRGQFLDASGRYYNLVKVYA